MTADILDLALVQALDGKRRQLNLGERWLYECCSERGLLWALADFRTGKRPDFNHFKPPLEATLTIELVPSTSWFNNIRSHVTKDVWDLLRREAYRRADYRCELCGGKGPRHPVECHERWFYDDIDNLQILYGLIALCPDCHRVKHMGKARMDGVAEQAMEHLRKVNKWSSETADAYVHRRFELWADRSEYEWFIDFTWLRERGYEPVENEVEEIEAEESALLPDSLESVPAIDKTADSDGAPQINLVNLQRIPSKRVATKVMWGAVLMAAVVGAFRLWWRYR